MKSLNLPLLGGVIECEPRAVPPEVIKALTSYRQACRLAWKLRRVRNLTRRTLAELAGLHAPHVTDYFSVHENRRELPARCVAAVKVVLGNRVISQYLAAQSRLTVLEELQAMRRAA